MEIKKIAIGAALLVGAFASQAGFIAYKHFDLGSLVVFVPLAGLLTGLFLNYGFGLGSESTFAKNRMRMAVAVATGILLYVLGHYADMSPDAGQTAAFAIDAIMIVAVAIFHAREWLKHNKIRFSVKAEVRS